MKKKDYSIYILECADGTLYTGITTDVKRRVLEHNTSAKGARYTKPRRPVKLFYTEDFNTKSEALKREIAIKKLTREQKMLLPMRKSD
jgi:putative endonuclease